MAAPSDPSPTRAPRTLAVVLPISLVLLFAAPALPAATIRVSANGQLALPQAIARAKDGDTIEGNAALMYCSSIGDLSMEGNTVSDTSGTTEDSRE